jgi:hypothetical protein
VTSPTYTPRVSRRGDDIATFPAIGEPLRETRAASDCPSASVAARFLGVSHFLLRAEKKQFDAIA